MCPYMVIRRGLDGPPPGGGGKGAGEAVGLGLVFVRVGVPGAVDPVDPHQETVLLAHHVLHVPIEPALLSNYLRRGVSDTCFMN